MEENLATLIVWGISFAIPTYTVWTHPNWKGVLLGALTLWIYFLLSGVFLIGRYGTGGPAAAGALLWMVAGWLPSGFYCLVVLMVSHAFRRKKGD